MEESNPHFSARASLMGIGVWMCQMKIWEIVKTHVRIKQKVIRFTPLEKLLDALIGILAGGHGMVEINTRVRPDEALQRAFDREGCAEQSTISDTLNACTMENVVQMRQALKVIYQEHSQGYRHPYAKQWQVLDVDMTGMPAGRQGEGVTKGYFAGEKNKRGRQLGRVTATLYDEIVVERLYNGKTQLDRSLQELVAAAADVLGLEPAQGRRTIVRIDGGGGNDNDINWMLRNDYQLMVKIKHWRCALKLGKSVTVWYPDPKVEGRDVGWVEAPRQYERPTRQLAIRNRKKDGSWSYHVVVFTLPDEALFELTGLPMPHAPTPDQVLFAALYAYDLRSGGVETTNKGSKQGLGLTKRNKQRFAAQEMLVLLAQLAFNLTIWARNRLADIHAPLRKFGILRMVRDVFQIAGRVELDAQGRVLQITFNQLHPLASVFVQAFSSLLAHDDLVLNLGQI